MEKTEIKFLVESRSTLRHLSMGWNKETWLFDTITDAKHYVKTEISILRLPCEFKITQLTTTTKIIFNLKGGGLL